MCYPIPAEHVEDFGSFFERLRTHAPFDFLPEGSSDPETPTTEPSTSVYWIEVEFPFIPRKVDSVLRMGLQMVLRSRCKTMLICYRFVNARFEATLFSDEPAKIEAIYNFFRGRMQRQAGHYERTGLTLW